MPNEDNWRKLLEFEQEKFFIDFKRQDELYTQALKDTNRGGEILALYGKFLESQGHLPDALKVFQELNFKSQSADTTSEIKKLEQSIKNK